MDASRTLLIGVDGGGSGCRAAIADAEGHMLGKGKAGAANVTTDPEGAIASVRAALDKAAQAAGLAMDEVLTGSAHIGLAGVQTPADAARVAAAFPFAGGCRVTDDRPTTAADALGGRDGVLLSVGTGSFAIRVHGGAVTNLGGWGFRLGDQASGAWLGRALLEHVLLAADGLAPASCHTEAVFERFGRDPNALVSFAAKATPGDFKGFAKSLARAAQAGDPVAHDLMARGAAYLARCIEALDPAPDEPIVLAGGLAAAYAEVLPEPLRARITLSEGRALDGALRLAAQLARGEVRT